MKIIQAQYTPSALKIFAGNPLIEALPNYLDYNPIEISKLLSKKPDALFDPLDSKIHRANWLMSLNRTLFISLTRHVQLQQLLDLMLRQSYMQRNPTFDDEYYANAYKKQKEAEAIGEKLATVDYGFHEVDPLSVAVIGLSGIGKSTAVGRIFNLYPQVIRHTQSSNCHMQFDQVVFLKVECPHAGSVKTLCNNIIEELGRLTNNNYKSIYVKSSRVTLDELKELISHLLAIHKVGILAIDEIQNITSVRKSRDELCNFIVSIANGLGVSLLFIGTRKILQFMQRGLRLARRFGSCGTFDWGRMEHESTDWRKFSIELWKYNVLNNEPAQMPKDIDNALYEYSQGITDILVKLFILSQIRALVANQERLNENIIKKVFDEHFNTVKPIIKALRDNDEVKLRYYEDVYISDEEFDNIVKTMTNELKEPSNFNAEEDTIVNLKKLVINFLTDGGMNITSDIERKIDQILQNDKTATMPTIVFKIINEFKTSKVSKDRALNNENNKLVKNAPEGTTINEGALDDEI